MTRTLLLCLQLILYFAYGFALPVQHFHPHAAFIVLETDGGPIPTPAEVYGTCRRIMEGQLVSSIDDASLCVNSTSHDSLRMKYGGKIILLGAASCSYISRAEKIQEAGGIAVIIKDNAFPWLQGLNYAFVG